MINNSVLKEIKTEHDKMKAKEAFKKKTNPFGISDGEFLSLLSDEDAKEVLKEEPTITGDETITDKELSEFGLKRNHKGGYIESKD